MCSVCGCGNTDAHSHAHAHTHGHTHAGSALQAHHHHAVDLSAARIVEVEKDILSQNNLHAESNHRWLHERNALAINFISSPGSGKTSILERSIKELGQQHAIAVVEGDQHTENDAQRIRQAGAQAIQINTGRGCHLDAHMVGHALEDLSLENNSLVFIENVGNLICPALFKLGEDYTIAILSVTEGEDKPIKYPDVFANADLLLLNKIDLLPYLDFDVERCIEYARRIKPALEVLQVSAKTGTGMENWYSWLEQAYRNR